MLTTPQPYPLSSSRLSDISNFIAELANTATNTIQRFGASNTGQFPAQLPGISGSAPQQPQQGGMFSGGNLMVASNYLLIAGIGLLVIAGILWAVKK